ncbi:FMN-linked oxidoreductase, partial [Trametes maxima]
LYEHFAPIWGSGPHEGFIDLYSKWGDGGWGMILTGNVQVDKRHMSIGRDLLIPDEITPATLAPWRRLADAIHYGSAPPPSDTDTKRSDAPSSRPLALIQLSHAGRQSMNVYSGRKPFEPPLAPSAIRVGDAHAATDGWFSRALHQLMLQVPREMTLNDIQYAVSEFVRGAQVAVQSGFDGVQVHAAHGYLVSQFISPKSNTRTDEYSADRDPLHFLRDIVQAIRAPGVVPADFIVGVKLNSADYARDTAQPQENRALNHVREIGSWGLVDYIEVSGGDYEDPQFIDTVENFKSPRQVIFESFASQSMDILSTTANPASRPPPLVCLTGGLSTLPKLTSVLSHSHAHLLGLGRLSILHPHLPSQLRAALAAHAAGQPSTFLLSPPPTLPSSGLGVAPTHALSARGVERLLCYILTLLWSLIPIRIPRIVGASASVGWYNIMLRRLAAGQDIDYTIGTIGATGRFYLGPTPYSPRDFEGRGGRVWWVLAGLVGVAIGVGLGQVV